jgi:hypothetical protein
MAVASFLVINAVPSLLDAVASHKARGATEIAVRVVGPGFENDPGCNFGDHLGDQRRTAPEKK